MTNRVINYLYSKPIQLTTQEGVRLNAPMYRSEIKLYRRTTNKVEFELRDSDRKPIKLLNRSVRVFFMNKENNELMLERECKIVDELKGLYAVILFPGDIETWSSGFYSFTVILRNEYDQDEVLYIDTAQNAVGSVELVDGGMPVFVPSIEIMPSDFHEHSGVLPFFVTSRYPGDSLINSQDALHTFAVYATNWSGKFIVQASIEDYPNDDSQWFDVPVEDQIFNFIEYSNFTGLQPYNFIVSTLWVRFKMIPDVGTYANTGTIDKIIYKN